MLWITLGLLASHAEDLGSLDGLRAMRRGAWRAAHIRFEASLAANPDDLETQGQLASAYARGGRFADAAPLFDMAAFGPWYEEKGLSDHADALRALGRGDEAARLRLSTLAVEDGRSALVMQLAAVDDLLGAGLLHEAEELAWSTAGEFPRSPAALAWLATVYVDQGRLDEAEAWLWLAEQQGPPSNRSILLRGRIALARGELVEARHWFDLAVDRRPDSRLVMAWRAELERLDGNCPASLNLTDKTRFGHHEQPEAMAVEARCLLVMDYSEEARELLDRALAVYPQHPWVLQAAGDF